MLFAIGLTNDCIESTEALFHLRHQSHDEVSSYRIRGSKQILLGRVVSLPRQSLEHGVDVGVMGFGPFQDVHVLPFRAIGGFPSLDVYRRGVGGIGRELA